MIPDIKFTEEQFNLIWEGVFQGAYNVRSFDVSIGQGLVGDPMKERFIKLL